jgi:putative FmdB family regulatory protein
MPTYEFRCEECGTTFEVEESISDHDRDVNERRAACPKCGSVNVAPQIAAFEVRTSRKSA